MNLLESFKLVYKNMIEKKGRVFLTLTGIIIGIFTFTFFIFVSQGLSNAIAEQFNALGTNTLIVQSIENSGNVPAGGGISDTQVSKIKQVVREYEYIAPGILYNAQYEYGNEKQFLRSVGYDGSNFDEILNDMNYEVESGRLIKSTDKGSITIGHSVAYDTFEKDIQVGNSLKFEGSSYRVVGIAKKQGSVMVDNAVLMSFDEVQKVSSQYNDYSLVRIKFLEGADLDFYKNAIEDKLNPNDDEKNYAVTSSADIIEQFDQIIGLLTAIITFISSIALLVGGINVMNTMYSNVIERINEISVMKALGATNGTIRNLFLFESAILGTIGALIGFFSSFTLAKILSIIITNYFGYNVPVYFEVNFFLGVIIVTAFFASIFGTYPAIRASYVNPADNLKDE